MQDNSIRQPQKFKLVLKKGNGAPHGSEWACGECGNALTWKQHYRKPHPNGAIKGVGEGHKDRCPLKAFGDLVDERDKDGRLKNGMYRITTFCPGCWHIMLEEGQKWHHESCTELEDKAVRMGMLVDNFRRGIDVDRNSGFTVTHYGIY